MTVADPLTPTQALHRAQAALEMVARLSRGHTADPGEESRRLQDAFEALVACLDLGVERIPHEAAYIFMRLAAHEELKRMAHLGAMDWEMARLGRLPGAHLQVQMARTPATPEGRRDFLAQRRAWGRAVEQRIGGVRLARDWPKPVDAPVRIGFVSDDLRHTIIGAFAWPLFQHRDRRNTELFVYSAFPGPQDPIEKHFAAWSDTYHRAPGASPRRMAEQIAADGVDLVIDLGAAYAWEVAAHRPAPIQASWMGYSSSVGLGAIDWIIVDPFLAPEAPDLLLEKPLILPASWISMTGAYFEDEPRPGGTPESANGRLTFGTLNATYKYSEACLETWAEIVSATPGSRFLVVRPEADAPGLRANLERVFARFGVTADRLEFRAVRGDHLKHYNDIDIALDTFPVTGGTTTCETLWMGTPVVSLLGEAMHERVSYSILCNAGLPDLVARTPAEYVGIALELAHDHPRRERLKSGLRDQIRSRPIGQPETHARDFYAALVGLVRRRRAAA
jgi:predicted O-linked N-acetylglucosamine transferase (SPINDLY family)